MKLSLGNGVLVKLVNIDNTNEFPSYSFRTPGPKTVTLIINGEYKFKTSKIIYIKPTTCF